MILLFQKKGYRRCRIVIKNIENFCGGNFKDWVEVFKENHNVFLTTNGTLLNNDFVYKKVKINKERKNMKIIIAKKEPVKNTYPSGGCQY